MKLFNRYKYLKHPGDYVWQDSAAVRIFNAVHKMQLGFASFMNRKVNHLTVQRKRTFFIIFFFLTCGLSTYYIIQGFFHSDTREVISNADHIKFPIKIEDDIDYTISEKDYKSIISFRKYMDSLQQNENGKHQYDSILQARPGLMDSVQALEQLYLSQQKH